MLVIGMCARAQSPVSDEVSRPEMPRRQEPGAVRQIANGTGDIGLGAAKGAGHVALGAAKGAGNLVTLHPIDAAVLTGKGAIAGGRDITTGAVKGSGKIGRGVGHGLRRLF